MKLLLDTHIVLWWLRDDPRLGHRTKALIAEAQAEILVSVASFWELSIKARNGKFAEPGSVLFAEAQRAGLMPLDVCAHHLVALEGIVAQPKHQDPFDHLILAQAIAEDALLVTNDRNLRRYGVRCFPA